jgi:hypothetical protein
MKKLNKNFRMERIFRFLIVKQLSVYFLVELDSCIFGECLETTTLSLGTRFVEISSIILAFKEIGRNSWTLPH